MAGKKIYKNVRERKRLQNRRYYAKSAVYESHVYTVAEDEQILRHDIPDSALSVIIGHSVKGIQCRRERLKQKLSVM